MRKHILHRILLLPLLLSLLLPGPVSADFIWCIGAEGSPRLEYVPQGECGSAGDCEEGHAEYPAGQEATESLAGDHCGSCLDLPVFSGTFRPSQRFHDDLAVPASLAVPLSPAPSFLPDRLTAVVAGFRPQPPPPLQQSTLFQRTTVLRN